MEYWRRDPQGQSILNAMKGLETSEALLWVVSDDNHPQGFTGQSQRGGMALYVNPTDRPDIAESVKLAHELGHAVSWLKPRDNKINSVFLAQDFENNGRTMRGCATQTFVGSFFHQRACP